MPGDDEQVSTAEAQERADRLKAGLTKANAPTGEPQNVQYTPLRYADMPGVSARQADVDDMKAGAKKSWNTLKGWVGADTPVTRNGAPAPFNVAADQHEPFQVVSDAQSNATQQGLAAKNEQDAASAAERNQFQLTQPRFIAGSHSNAHNWMTPGTYKETLENIHSDAEAKIARNNVDAAGDNALEVHYNTVAEQEKRQLQEDTYKNAMRTAEAERVVNSMYKERNDAANKQIDPERYWKSKSDFQKAMIGIGGILQGVGQSILAPGTPNPAIAELNNSINRDIDSQKEDIDQARWKVGQGHNIVGDIMRKYNIDADKAAEIAKVGSRAALAAQADAIAHKTKSEQALINNKAIQAGEQTATTAAHTALDQRTWNDAHIEGGTATGSAGPDPKLFVVTGTDRNGRPTGFYAAGPDEYKDATKHQRLHENKLRLANEVERDQAIVDKEGETKQAVYSGLPARMSSALTSDARKRLDQHTAELDAITRESLPGKTPLADAVKHRQGLYGDPTIKSNNTPARVRADAAGDLAVVRSHAHTTAAPNATRVIALDQHGNKGTKTIMGNHQSTPVEDTSDLVEDHE